MQVSGRVVAHVLLDSCMPSSTLYDVVIKLHTARPGSGVTENKTTCRVL